MKIKVKRYKEIEHIAIVEAVQRILGEADIRHEQVKAAVLALENTGLPADVIGSLRSALYRHAIVNGSTLEDLGLEPTRA